MSSRKGYSYPTNVDRGRVTPINQGLFGPILLVIRLLQLLDRYNIINSRGRATFDCFGCGEPNHWVRDFPETWARTKFVKITSIGIIRANRDSSRVLEALTKVVGRASR